MELLVDRELDSSEAHLTELALDRFGVTMLRFVVDL